MPLDPESWPGSSGGGLPSQWTVETSGAVEITSDDPLSDVLVVQAPDDETGYIFSANSFSGTDGVSVTGDGADGVLQVKLNADAALNATIQLSSDDVIALFASGRLTLYGSSSQFGGMTAAPADGLLDGSDFALWLDDTPAATKLMIKAKDSGGTVRTAAIVLA